MLTISTCNPILAFRAALCTCLVFAMTTASLAASAGTPADAGGPYEVSAGGSITLSANGELQRARLVDLGLALANHSSLYGRFPPAYVADASGTPLFSWRVLLLPLLGEGALFAQFDTTRAWDDPVNLPVLAQMPDAYRGPGDAVTQTDTAYAGVFRAFAAGSMSNAIFEGPQSDIVSGNINRGTVGFAQIPDGSSMTAAIGQIVDASIPWTAPLDVDVSANPALGDAAGFSSDLDGAVPFVYADGTVHYLSLANDPAVVAAAYTRDGGDSVAGLVEIDFGNIISYAWDFDNDGQFDDASGATPVFNASQLIPAVYPVTLQTTDAGGNTTSAVTAVTVRGCVDNFFVRGKAESSGALLNLVWTPVGDAASYDILRSAAGPTSGFQTIRSGHVTSRAAYADKIAPPLAPVYWYRVIPNGSASCGGSDVVRTNLSARG